MSYRKDAREFHRDAHWSFWKFLPLCILCVVVLGGVGFAAKSLGLWGSTVVERKVFENSYQRQEALRSQIAQEEATLAQIEIIINTPGLTLETTRTLMAQQRAAEMRLHVAKAKLNR